MERFHPLFGMAEKVIIHAFTEPPYTKENIDGEGVLLCKRCDLPLFLSDSFFLSGCGWPSFDEAFKENITFGLDKDGVRTEVFCKRCRAHLGHLFEGEGFTKTNQRFCMNGVALELAPLFRGDGERALFAGGCFWSTQYFFSQEKGVLQTFAGYMGGSVVEPTYKEVCSGQTGHRECVEILFDPTVVHFSSLVQRFFEIHDFEDGEGQGLDRGEQYKPACFFLSLEQKESIEKQLSLYRQKNISVKTEILPASRFYKAEEYHQNYYQKMGKSPSCGIG